MEISEETRQLAKKTIVQQEGETFDSYYSRYTEFVISQMFPNSETSSTGAAITEGRDGSATLPPLLIRGWNFANAMARHIASGLKRCSKKQINERLAICQVCPNLVDNHCKLCGCACVAENQLMNKLALASEKCPIGKWE